jgi:uncharacterized LabA/DUF88 family protein
MSKTPTDQTSTRSASRQDEAPAADATAKPAAHPRNRRASAHAKSAEKAPNTASPRPTVVEVTATTAAPATPPATTPARRTTRRAGKTFAPKLVTPAVAALDDLSEGAASAVAAPVSDVVAEPHATAPTEPVQPVDVQPTDTEVAPPKRHRFRFERPAQQASQFAPRPERLSGAATSAAPAANGTSSQVLVAVPASEGTGGSRVNGAAAESIESAVHLAPSEAEPEAVAEPGAEHSGTERRGATEQQVESPHAGEDDATTAHEAGEDGDETTAARRRRRRRRSGGTGIRHLEPVAPNGVEPEPYTGSDDLDAYSGAHEVSVIPSYGDTAHPAALRPANEPDDWSVGAAYQQLGQPRSPFGAPEPNAARGFGAQPQGTATQYQDRPARAARTERGIAEASPAGLAQLGSTLTQAIQQQTDRLLVSMRHAMTPPSMTVTLPATPSTERIGVFVDVANLLYSSRSLRVGIDFGRLLEFLRGNRHLVRAHAYAPTNPEPNAEQQFLSVVKGVGYRITTKNFKVFSSGAKKADLDLDLCMDIVRLVDARAVDSIVLVSGDSDFLPLLEYCSDRGVRVEVAAFEDAAAMILRQSCDLFINLSLVDEIRP